MRERESRGWHQNRGALGFPTQSTGWGRLGGASADEIRPRVRRVLGPPTRRQENGMERGVRCATCQDAGAIIGRFLGRAEAGHGHGRRPRLWRQVKRPRNDSSKRSAPFGPDGSSATSADTSDAASCMEWIRSRLQHSPTRHGPTRQSLYGEESERGSDTYETMTASLVSSILPHGPAEQFQISECHILSLSMRRPLGAC